MIKKIFKYLFLSLGVLIIIFLVAVFMRQNLKYDAPYPNIKSSTDSLIISRGKYLVMGPAHCADCHAPISMATQVAKGIEVPLSGGHEFPLPVGTVYTPNITPDKETGIGNLKDEEIARILRYGVGEDGRCILDFMPFHNLSDEDLTAVISFLRSQQPVNNKVKPHDYNFLGKIVKAFILKPVGPDGDVPQKVTEGPTVEYGHYLARNVANCRGCHTERDLMTGKFVGPDYAGGFKMQSELNPAVYLVTPNITPDPKTGKITTWSEDDFVKRFRTGKVIAESTMPWGPLSRIKEDDLRAIYKYLKTVTPVERDNGPVLTTK